MTRARKDLGDAGEEFAARTLSVLGYRIVARNLRSRRGEIDIVAEIHGEVYFVEVRTISRARWGTPLYTVNRAKQNRIIGEAMRYIASAPRATAYHFSVFALVKHPFEYEFAPDAFVADLAWG